MRSGGTIPGLDDKAAFTLTPGGSNALPILLAVPHDGTDYPRAVIEMMRSPASTCLRLEDRRVGDIADRVADRTGVSLLKALAPRAMIDLNRSSDDIDWGMVANAHAKPDQRSRNTFRSRYGLGLVPRRVSGVGEIWRRPIDKQEIDRRIEQIHVPYHLTIAEELQRLRDVHGVALLMDLHSMPPLKPTAPGDRAADFVLGDRFGASCGVELSDVVLNYLAAMGRKAAYNRPYAGGYILERHGQPMRGIHAMQLEISRGLYLDAALDRPTVKLPAISRLVAGLLSVLGSQLLKIQGAPNFLQAAE